MKVCNITALILSLVVASNSLFAQTVLLNDEEFKEIREECELEAKELDLKGDEKTEYVTICIKDLVPENDAEELSDDELESTTLR